MAQSGLPSSARPSDALDRGRTVVTSVNGGENPDLSEAENESSQPIPVAFSVEPAAGGTASAKLPPPPNMALTSQNPSLAPPAEVTNDSTAAVLFPAEGEGAKKRNTSFKITNILPSRPPSNDPEESGDDDVDDSRTEDISDNVDPPAGDSPAAAAAPAPAENTVDSKVATSSAAATAVRRNSSTKPVATHQKPQSSSAQPPPMGYRFNIFVYASKHGSGNEPLRVPAAQVGASAAAAYVSAIEEDVHKTVDEAAEGEGKANPKHGPQDRFKVVKIQTATSKILSRWTLVDYSNKSGPLAPPPPAFVSNSSPGMSLAKLPPLPPLKPSAKTDKVAAPAAAAAAAAAQLPRNDEAQPSTSLDHTNVPADIPIKKKQTDEDLGASTSSHHQQQQVDVLTSTAQPTATATLGPPTQIQQSASGASSIVHRPNVSLPLSSSSMAVTSVQTPSSSSNSMQIQRNSSTSYANHPSLQGLHQHHHHQQPPLSSISSIPQSLQNVVQRPLDGNAQQTLMRSEPGENSVSIPSIKRQQQQQQSQQAQVLGAQMVYSQPQSFQNPSPSQNLSMVPGIASTHPHGSEDSKVSQQQIQVPFGPQQQQQQQVVSDVQQQQQQLPQQPPYGPDVGMQASAPSVVVTSSVLATRDPKQLVQHVPPPQQLPLTADMHSLAQKQQAIPPQTAVVSSCASGKPEEQKLSLSSDSAMARRNIASKQPPVCGELLVERLEEISTQHGSYSGGDPDTDSASGANQGAIDNRIEQAMDLVKSHLMNAVRSEVEEMKEKIIKLEDKISSLQSENDLLKANVPSDILLQISSSASSNSTQAAAAPAASTQAAISPASAAQNPPLPPPPPPPSSTSAPPLPAAAAPQAQTVNAQQSSHPSPPTTI